MLTEQDYAEILSDAEERYDDDVRSVACGIARLAFAENGIDKNTARTMAYLMAWLAGDLLKEAEIDWDRATLAALKKIRRSNPDVEREFEELAAAQSQ